jgi:hypothetical protein
MERLITENFEKLNLKHLNRYKVAAVLKVVTMLTGVAVL